LILKKFLLLGFTILHQAVMDNALELVNILAEFKADVNISNDDGWTPLHLAGLLCAL
jgi:ankyrin repeat protein